jgi:hypothetical protein
LRYRHTMSLPRFMPAQCCAGLLMIALGLGSAYAASTTTSTKKTHSTAHLHHATSTQTKHSSSHQASLHHTSSSSHHHKSKHHQAVTGQRVMDSSRASEIQQALIQAHYLNGSPTGQWDADTQAAMVKYQTDNGWQSKITPDSRALIKLGLGPKQDAGEYAAHPAGISEISSGSAVPNSSNGTPTDTIRTMATSETPKTSASN